jgi:ribose transport system permease protein
VTTEAPARVPARTPIRTAGQWLADHPAAIAAIIAVAMFAVGELVSPGFAGYGQVLNVLRVAAFLGIVAAGQTLVIVSGGEGVDLSVGKVATFAAIIAARTIDGTNEALLPGLALTLGACALIGLVNGLGIAYLRIPPLVMTLGMVAVVQGVILIYTGGQPAGRAAPLMVDLVSGRTVFGIPGILWIWLILGVGMVLLMRRTTFGWRVYALGTNRLAAQLSGISVRPNLVAVYVLSAVLAGLGGFFLLGYTQTVFLNLADSMMLPSVAAVVIGGTTLAGGVGGYPGTAVGAIVLTLLESLLRTMQLDAASRQIVNGVVLILLLSVYGRQRRLRQ